MDRLVKQAAGLMLIGVVFGIATAGAAPHPTG